ncbi:bacillithiol biosynthesis cysteine-adding enzyme BshC [Paenibacillus senegalensis]|uniref:bacillithiol biosynthesis cysteine-adding enzyme BshC n=1 Tax=Paenibacillus senegalensis TaxID=1465766 RepID=UPI0002895243|nr:bacillithiol biosynthesis cysteine-adding enzyme BshC [Paenibacillus senegalensis]
MKIIPFERNSGQRLAADYYHQFSKVSEFYEYNPWDGDSWAIRAEALGHPRSLTANRTELVHSLIRYNDKVNNAAEAFQALEQLKNENTLVVVGGQQAGLFTGPLLVIYKAITIIQAAKHAAEKLGRAVVPVFWIAGEDHDIDEVNHTYVHAHNEAVKIKLSPAEGEPRTSISRLTVKHWEDVLQQLDKSLMDTEFKAPIMDQLTLIAGQSSTLSEFFARIMASLFGRHGLILLDSDDPGIRKLEGAMFEQLLEQNELISEAFLNESSKLVSAGYQPQVETSPLSANLFVFGEDGERRLLQRSSSGFTDKRGEQEYSLGELQEMAWSRPGSLSNNVITRPLMQEFLLPVLASVLGPGEIAYWGQLRQVFGAVGMQMPILLPRKEHTLVEGTVQKYIDKYELTLEEAFDQWEEKKEEWLRSQDELCLEERFKLAKEQFAEIYKPILQAVAKINPGMEKLGQTNAAKIVEQIDFLQARSIEANKSQYEAALRQWDRIRNTLFPLGKPQERVYNLYSYVNKYGHSWLEELVAQPLQLRPLHSIVYL